MVLNFIIIRQKEFIKSRTIDAFLLTLKLKTINLMMLMCENILSLIFFIYI